MKNAIHRFLYFAAGAEPFIVQQCTPQEAGRYRTAGAMVLIPALLGFFSGKLALCYLTDSTFLQFAGALLYAGLIFTIDRGIMVFTKPGMISAGALMRIGMAGSLAFTIGEPIVLEAFDDAIRHKQAQDAVQIREQLMHSFGREKAALNRQVAECRSLQESKWESVLAEMDGRAGPAGYGEEARRKEQAFAEHRRYCDSLEAHTRRQIAELHVQTLRSIELQCAAIPGSLAGRLQTLEAVSATHPAILWASWLIRALLFFLEMLPLSIKLSSAALGDDNLYNSLSRLYDNICLEAERLLRPKKMEAALAQKEAALELQKLEQDLQRQMRALEQNRKALQFQADQYHAAVLWKQQMEQNMHRLAANEQHAAALLADVARLFEPYLLRFGKRDGGG